MKALFFILLFSIPFISLSKPKVLKPRELKDKISQFGSDVMKIKASLQSLDKELDNQNQTYLSQVQKEQKLEDQISKMKVGAGKNKEKIILNLEQIKKKYYSVVLLNNTEKTLEENMKEKLILQDLAAESEILEELLTENKALVNLLDKMNLKLNELREEKNQLYSILNDLEKRKGGLKDSYFASLESKKQLEKELTRQKLEIIAKDSKVNIFELIPPFKKLGRVEETSQGVNFFFDSDQPLHSVSSGKVVYTGQLANYGTVIMIKHQGDLRSVILGPFKSKVSRGDVLQKGQLIGYASSKGLEDQEKKIYIELREKETPLMTAQYLNPSYRI